MSLEEALKANTAAVEALTAAVKSAGVAAATTTNSKTDTAKAPAPAPKPPAKSKLDIEKVKAALTEVMEKVMSSGGSKEEGVAAGRALFQHLDKAAYKKMGDIREEHFQTVYDAAKAKMAELEAGGSDDSGSDDGGL